VARYFKPKYLRRYGPLQDGAMKYNNPVRPGLREAHRVSNGDCDIVLSLGTGFEQKLVSPAAVNVRSFFQDGALARFYRASMDSLSLNGQLSWEDHWYGLGEEAKKRQFRLNLPLVGKEPDLDNVDEMEYLYDQIPHHLGDLEGIARAFKAVSFFFELNEAPVLEGGLYECHGSILCRSPDSSALIKNLGTSYPSAQFYVNDSPLGYLSEDDVCQECGRFQKGVTFHVRHPSDRVNLYLAFNRLFRQSISAFPQSMEWFVNRQKLTAKFGQPNHDSRVAPTSLSCSCLARDHLKSASRPDKKRSLNFQHSTRRKRRRL